MHRCFELFVAAYGVTASGNWEGKTVLQRALDDASLASRFRVDEPEIQNRLDRGRGQLLQARNARVRPATDDKVICAWNGLMLRAFAQAGRFLEDGTEKARFREVATRNADFLLAELAAATANCGAFGETARARHGGLPRRLCRFDSGPAGPLPMRL